MNFHERVLSLEGYVQEAEHMYRTGVFDYANDYFVIKNMIWKKMIY